MEGEVKQVVESQAEGATTPALPKEAVSAASRSDLTVRELDGEVLIYDASSADTHHLNATALFIWRQCDGTNDADIIAERLSAVYDVSVEDAREHVSHMLREFQQRKLVGEADVPGRGGEGVSR